MRGAVGRLTLDRPRKLNALTVEMVAGIASALAAWRDDPAVRIVLLDATGPRGFCAGGDLQFVYASARAGNGAAERFWADEYRLNATIATYPKPVVALVFGIVMGGGIGLAGHARHRIVAETTRAAMPEVGIGLIPDVGSTFLLSRAPGETGTYLALTGAEIGASDAIAAGLADTLVRERDLPALAAALEDERPADDEAIRALVARFASAPGTGALAAERDLVDRAFAGSSVEEILAALDLEDAAFARDAARTIRAKSPTSVKLAFAVVRRARRLPDVAACLRLEHRVMNRLVQKHDFFEGVRAAVIEKDRRPAWDPPALADVAARDLEGYFASLGADELRV